MRALYPHVSVVRVAVGVKVGMAKFIKGDIVLVGGDNRVGQIWYSVDLDGACMTCVSIWPLIAKGNRWARARIGDNPELLPVSQLRGALIAHMTVDFATVILPLSIS